MKEIIRNIYLNYRKIFLRILTIKIPNKNLTNHNQEKDINKILFIRIDRIGDLVLSTPAITALKCAFPKSELTVLTSITNKSILINNPYVDKIVVYNHRHNLRDKFRIIKNLRNIRFDLSVDPYVGYELKSALISAVIGSKLRIGYAAYGREACFNLATSIDRTSKHFIDLTLGVLKPLGIHCEDKTPEIFLSKKEKAWAKNFLNNKVKRNRPIIGIHPGAYYESQRWPVKNFADLTTILQKKLKSNIIIFGGPGDHEIIDQIAATTTGNVFVHLTDDLRQFIALMSECSLLICNNSGPLHIAAALNKATVSTMGPTNKARWMPIGNLHKVLRIDQLPCIGCNLGYCKIKTHDCMNQITPSMVLDAVKNMVS